MGICVLVWMFSSLVVCLLVGLGCGSQVVPVQTRASDTCHGFGLSVGHPLVCYHVCCLVNNRMAGTCASVFTVFCYQISPPFLLLSS